MQHGVSAHSLHQACGSNDSVVSELQAHGHFLNTHPPSHNHQQPLLAPPCSDHVAIGAHSSRTGIDAITTQRASAALRSVVDDTSGAHAVNAGGGTAALTGGHPQSDVTPPHTPRKRTHEPDVPPTTTTLPSKRKRIRARRQDDVPLAPPISPPSTARGSDVRALLTHPAALPVVPGIQPSVLSSLFVSARARYSATTNSDSEPPPYSCWGLPPDGSAAVELFAGVGTISHALAHRHVRVATLCEKSPDKQVVNSVHLPSALLLSDADLPIPVPDEPIVHVSAGLPCQPVAPSGWRRAERDRRAPLVTESVPNAILRLQDAGKLVFLDIEEHADFATTGRNMLLHLRTNLLALPSPIYLSSPEFFTPSHYGGPIHRRRCALRGEPRNVLERIGNPPRLRPVLSPKRRIADIALPNADVRSDQYVDGVLTLIPHIISETVPTIAASVRCGGPLAPVVPGSRVHIDGDQETELVVLTFNDQYRRFVTLFHDNRDEPWFLRSVSVARISSHLATTFPVLSMGGIAASCTRVGVPPLGPAKQLWLRDGRAYQPDWRELIKLFDVEPTLLQPINPDANPEIQSHDTLSSIVGDMLSMRMADAMADRSVTRSLQYRTALAYDRWIAVTERNSIAACFGAHFSPIAYLEPGDVAVALIDSCGGALRMLVSNDLLQLPVAPHHRADLPRDSAVNVAQSFVSAVSHAHFDGRRLHGLLVHSTPSLTVVAFPLPEDTSPTGRATTDFSLWATLADVASSPLYVPMASAFARVAAHCQRGIPAITTTPADIPDGARRATPLLSLPYMPRAFPAAWPQQLHLLECYDTHLRRALNAASRSCPHRGYLASWVDQVDTTPNADIPFHLRGASPSEFDNPILVDTPFAAPMPTPALPPPIFPGAQQTSYKPRSIYQILKAGSIRKLARALNAIADSLAHMQRGEELPPRLRRGLTTTVIGQDGFVPEARGIIWDLRSRHPEGHFLPLDFTAPIATHLNTDAYFDAIGDDYPDQSLRHQVRHGALFFADVDLQIVICPHLLSLADGFVNVDKELRRLHSLGYLEFNTTEEEAFAWHKADDSQQGDVESLVVALGIIPCRCTPQGARARKLEPERPRRISDCGAPRKAVFDASSKRVVPLNEAIGFKRVEHGVQKFPTEHKPRMAHAMLDCSVLQSASRVWREPVLQFNDDTKDCFNQIYLHPSQIWLTSVLWLKLTGVPSACPYTHVIEHVFGFGIGCASGFAQRLGNSLLHLVSKRMDAMDAPFLEADARQDPSRAAWLQRRLELSKTTGRNEARLYACHIYTDDPEFMCVGFDRFIRLLTCWREVTGMIGLRMAIAAKRQAGTSILWQGIRLHGALGAAVIPPPKRQRAIAELTTMARGNPMRLDEAQSLAGLLEHLMPWAGELRAAMYHFYYPHRAFAALGPQHQFLPTDAMTTQAAKWITRLEQRPGISVLALLLSPEPITPGSRSLLVMSSDAAKSGTPTPGIGGYMHGVAWYLPLRPSDVDGPFEIPINVLEFIGVFGNFASFGADVPPCASLLALTDSLTTALVVSRHSARAPLMQLVHLRLLDLPEYNRVATRTEIAHVFGPANAIADAVSRGYFDILADLCTQLRVALSWVPPADSTVALLDDVRRAVRDAPGKPTDAYQNPPHVPNKGKRFSSDNEGDGPAYAPPPSLPPPPGQSSPLPSRDRLLYPHRPPRSPWRSPPRAPGPPVPDRHGRQPPPAPFASPHADFAWARNPPQPPPPHVVSRVSRPSRDTALLDVLSQDGSRFRLCPHDPGMLTALVRDVHSTPDLAVPRTTAAKDRSAWRKWVAFCRLLGTPEWRDCPDAHDGLDHNGRRRECFIQAAFLLWAYRTMVPRNRSSRLPKPASARACLDAVRRVHRQNDINMCPAPSIGRLVTGLLKEYIRVHGPECLTPSRREPLTNDQTAAILAVESTDSGKKAVRIGNRIVDWDTPFWISFAALLTTVRHTGARKADLLCHSEADFDNSAMSRSNLKWRIRGVNYDNPLPVALRDIQRGDCAVLIPGCTKSDPFALHFGDRPMYLPYLPDDPTNAAARLAQLEILCPVTPAARRRSPLFCADNTARPLTHAQADQAFNGLATIALGPAVATTLSLHSGRVWLACALLARHASNPTIQAMVRWLCPESIRIYAHMEPGEYENNILTAIGAPITSRLARNLPVVDADDCVAFLSDSLDELTEHPNPTPFRAPLPGPVSPPSSAQKRRTLFPADDGADADDDNECEVESSGLCDAGPLLADESIVENVPVAVPFRLGGANVHFAGKIRREAPCSSATNPQYNVIFPDGETWAVRRDRLFHVVELGARPLPA